MKFWRSRKKESESIEENFHALRARPHGGVAKEASESQVHEDGNSYNEPLNFEPKFTKYWSNTPQAIVDEIISNLLTIREAGGSVLILRTSWALGFEVDTSAYVQFLLQENDSVIVEVQGDYSYWGTSISPVAAWKFRDVGMTLPTKRFSNFARTISPSIDSERAHREISEIIRIFQLVLEPTGAIEASCF